MEDLSVSVAERLSLSEQQPAVQDLEDEEEQVEGDCLGLDVDDMTCAICLGQIPVADIAAVKGCDHQYCVHCILQWATFKEWCPQCKAPFSYLLTYRQLDGTMMDYPVEESVTLLKRARWFEDHMRAKEKGKAVARVADEPLQFTDADGDVPIANFRDWADYYEDMLDEELEEDEEIEQYYFSSAAGSARVVIGNRRNGQNGYLRSGRMYARPVPVTPAAATPAAGKGKKGGKGKKAGGSSGTGSSSGGGSAGASSGGSSRSCGGFGARMPKGSSPVLGAAGPLAGISSGSGAASSSSGGTSGSGRRAKRAQRRVAVDSWEDDY